MGGAASASLEDCDPGAVLQVYREADEEKKGGHDFAKLAISRTNDVPAVYEQVRKFKWNGRQPHADSVELALLAIERDPAVCHQFSTMPQGVKTNKDHVLSILSKCRQEDAKFVYDFLSSDLKEDKEVARAAMDRANFGMLAVYDGLHPNRKADKDLAALMLGRMHRTADAYRALPAALQSDTELCSLALTRDYKVFGILRERNEDLLTRAVEHAKIAIRSSGQPQSLVDAELPEQLKEIQELKDLAQVCQKDVEENGPPSGPKSAVRLASESELVSMVEKHASTDDCWVILNGRVYDLTDYLKSEVHPTGNGSILEWAGKDASEPFNMYHPPSVLSTLPADACLGP